MIKAINTDKYNYPLRLNAEIERLCNKPEVVKVISVSVAINNQNQYIGFIVYESSDGIQDL